VVAGAGNPRIAEVVHEIRANQQAWRPTAGVTVDEVATVVTTTAVRGRARRLVVRAPNV
jgi:hypothetical protein